MTNELIVEWGSRPRGFGSNFWEMDTFGEWSSNPLGQQWVLTPWSLPGHVHLPYSIEERCLSVPTKPHHERREAALIFAKYSSYFDYSHVSPRGFWSNLTQDPTLELLSTADIDEGHPLPTGLASMGSQTRQDYDALVGDVKAIIGMGWPAIRSSVYTALCQGTPAIIPYFKEDLRLDGWHQYTPDSQHGPALTLGEPYVYGYNAHNYTQLEDAVRRAMNTKIERYIPPNMKLDFALTQLSSYLNRDAQAIFHESVAENGDYALRCLPVGDPYYRILRYQTLEKQHEADVDLPWPVRCRL